MKKAEWAEVTESTWYEMAFQIAKARPEDFFRLHALCNKHVKVPDASLPTTYAAQYMYSPSLAASSKYPPPPPPPRRAADGTYVGPAPPPPPAKASNFSLMTRDGPMPFVPDQIFEC